MDNAPPDPSANTPRAEVVQILVDLIRIDTTNAGPDPATVGELLAAQYVHGLLLEAGYRPQLFHTTNQSRAGVVLRIPGTEPDAAQRALLLHSHLDVVPADPRNWTHPPFSGVIAPDPASGEEMVWGRGAVDMKDMVAMILAVLRDWGHRGIQPKRDIVALFLPDEEAGSREGSHWLVENEPGWFTGVTEAIGEVGGFSMTMPSGRRLYLVQTAEKGIAWLRLTARGRAGHGSMRNHENAVTELAEAVARVGRHRFELTLTPTTTALLAQLSHELGIALDPQDPGGLLTALGPHARNVGASLHNTANPTMLAAGVKVNVIPDSATAQVDCRFLPGEQDSFLAELDALLGPRVTRETLNLDVALETHFDGPTVAAMAAALGAADPGCSAVPYMLPAGTDAKAFSRLGIRCYGFAPLRLPPDLDFAPLFHGVDERVPISGLHFGVEVLSDFLQRC